MRRPITGEKSMWGRERGGRGSHKKGMVGGQQLLGTMADVSIIGDRGKTGEDKNSNPRTPRII